MKSALYLSYFFHIGLQARRLQRSIVNVQFWVPLREFAPLS